MKRQSRANEVGPHLGTQFGARILCLGLASAAYVGVAAPAHAGELTRATYTGEEKNKFDLHFGISYSYDFKRAAVMREWNDAATGQNEISRDLIYRSQRHTVTPMLEIGLYRGLSVYTEIPIVVNDTRDYGFDQDASDCVFPNEIGAGTGVTQATCVDKTNSSTIRDGIVPVGGYDASAENPFTEPGLAANNTELIFRSPVRKGLDQIHAGLKYAVLSQRYRSHMPTWIIAVEGRFAVGKPMTMVRTAGASSPSGNSSVGRGIHELGVWTALSRRFRYLEPYFGGYWRQAFSAANSNFKDFGNGQQAVQPMSSAGLIFGTELIPWEVDDMDDQGNPGKAYRKFSILLHGTADYFYGGANGGRAYSEVWELLSDSPALVGTNDPVAGGCTSAAVGRALNYAATNRDDPTDYLGGTGGANDGPGGGNCRAFNGITNVQDYAMFGLMAALNFHIGPYARINFGADVKTVTRHFLTGAPRGIDRNNNGTVGNAAQGDNPNEINPVRRDVVDNVGRRYVLDDMINVRGFFNFLLTF